MPFFRFSIFFLLFFHLFLVLPEAYALSFFKSDAYKVKIEGEMPGSVEDVLESASQTFALKERPIPTVEMLRRRANLDIPEMIKALRSEGYYDGEITIEVQTTKKKPLVIFHVNTGPAYVLDQIFIENLREESARLLYPTPKNLGLVKGQRARASEVLKGEENLREFLRDHGIPMPRAHLQEAIVNHETRTMDVHYAFRAETLAFFGEVSITGNKRVKTQYIENYIPWKKGELFRISHINKLKSNLMQDGLFSTVDIRYRPERDPQSRDNRDRRGFGRNTPDRNDPELDDEALPIQIQVKERNRRTVRAGLFYETDTGSGVSMGWEHRNLHGMGEKLSLDALVAENEKRALAQYRIPDFLAKNQSLTWSAWLGKEETDAYDSESTGVSLKLFRQMTRTWSGGIGVSYRVADVTQLGHTETYGLLSFPVELSWDKRNDMLNPTRGARIQWKAEPFHDTLHMDTWFTRLIGNVSLYLPLTKEDRFVIALRGSVGSIVGESNLDIPADERFYGGGGGSIRGYKYQSVGPERNGAVVGGRSMMETSLELRYRLKNNMGFVAFLDGGQVDTTSELQFSEDLRWGAGFGFRYYTSFAPFRIDFGFPLNKRDRDDPVQMYISIGQAF
ncbi:BamA/TamA family outer membrane protein [Desulfococcaceae bacterium OttesenSCG-928-F15]|nr:BamA/TamA family outer membrane protein [Desulfococcaceae bacterium OttesenSCG-928-F15]